MAKINFWILFLALVCLGWWFEGIGRLVDDGNGKVSIKEVEEREQEDKEGKHVRHTLQATSNGIWPSLSIITLLQHQYGHWLYIWQVLGSRSGNRRWLGLDRVNRLNEYKKPSLECGVNGTRKRRIMI